MGLVAHFNNHKSQSDGWSVNKTDFLNDYQLRFHAEQILVMRTLRARHLSAVLFGEGGWNILLDLFIQEIAGKDVSITSACIASLAPPTTGLRYVELLIGLGLIARIAHPNDRRSSHLTLTYTGREAMRSLLNEMAIVQSTIPTSGSFSAQKAINAA